MTHILVFGDSLSDGFMLPRDQAWPALLIPKFRAAKLDAEILNASQSGGTTSDGLERLGPHLRSKIDIFVLELGINDAFHGTPVDQIRENLQEIIDRLKRAHPRVRIIICGMQLPNYSSDHYVDEFAKMYVDLAAKTNSSLVPYLLEGVSGDPQLNLPDLIHPNAGGHKILAENVWRALGPIVHEVSHR